MGNSAENAERIIFAARTALKTPWVHQGRRVGVGLDCAGLLAYVFKYLELNHKDTKGYPRTPYDRKLLKILDDQPCLERIHELEAGCVLAMRFKKEPQHIAIWTGEKIIHGSQTVGIVTEHAMPPKDQHKIMAIYRILLNE